MDTDRLATFSDGVFAIAITVLVLGIAVPRPETALGSELLRLWPSYCAYVVSFLLIGQVWINHHAMFRHIARADSTLLVLNLLLLMDVAFLPFPTAVLADAFHRGTDERVAAAFYGGTLVVGGVLFSGVWRYAAHGHRLLGEHLSANEAGKIGRRFLIGPPVYVVAMVVGLLLPWLALVLYALLIVFYLWPGRVHEYALTRTSDRSARPDAERGDGGKRPEVERPVRRGR